MVAMHLEVVFTSVVQVPLELNWVEADFADFTLHQDVVVALVVQI